MYEKCLNYPDCVQRRLLYKAQQRKVEKLVEVAKKAYYSNKVETESYSIFKCFDEITNKRKVAALPSNLDKKKTNDFNNFFANVGLEPPWRKKSQMFLLMTNCRLNLNLCSSVILP